MGAFVIEGQDRLLPLPITAEGESEFDDLLETSPRMPLKEGEIYHIVERRTREPQAQVVVRENDCVVAEIETLKGPSRLVAILLGKPKEQLRTTVLSNDGERAYVGPIGPFYPPVRRSGYGGDVKLVNAIVLWEANPPQNAPEN